MKGIKRERNFCVIESEWLIKNERKCDCKCVFVCVFLCVWVCVCVRERERERERVLIKWQERERAAGWIKRVLIKVLKKAGEI